MNIDFQKLIIQKHVIDSSSHDMILTRHFRTAFVS